MFAAGDDAINETHNDFGWHLLVDKTFLEGVGSTDRFDRQVEALLNETLAILNLPVTLLQTISTRLIQVVAKSGGENPAGPVSIRVYIQEPVDPTDHSGTNGWGYFLVERSSKHPDIPTEVSDNLIEIFLYTEGGGAEDKD